jgi:hypothetical protein
MHQGLGKYSREGKTTGPRTAIVRQTNIKAYVYGLRFSIQTERKGRPRAALSLFLGRDIETCTRATQEVQNNERSATYFTWAIFQTESLQNRHVHSQLVSACSPDGLMSNRSEQSQGTKTKNKRQKS